MAVRRRSRRRCPANSRRGIGSAPRTSRSSRSRRSRSLMSRADAVDPGERARRALRRRMLDLERDPTAVLVASACSGRSCERPRDRLCVAGPAPAAGPRPRRTATIVHERQPDRAPPASQPSDRSARSEVYVSRPSGIDGEDDVGRRSRRGTGSAPRTRAARARGGRARSCRGRTRWRRRSWPSSSSVAKAMNSAGIGRPSRWRRLSRPRSSWNAGPSCRRSSRARRPRCDDSWTSAPKCLPSSSSGRQPVSRSQVSETNVNRASASIDQTRSGEFWTR